VRRATVLQLLDVRDAGNLHAIVVNESEVDESDDEEADADDAVTDERGTGAAPRLRAGERVGGALPVFGAGAVEHMVKCITSLRARGAVCECAVGHCGV
jgi:hypothetical protein